ncbi:MAG: hypothetical protein WAV16_02155 [Candidatus Moraniibacteriota bacterium]
MPETTKNDPTTPFAIGGRALAQAQLIADKTIAKLRRIYSIEDLKKILAEALRETEAVTHQ